MPGGDRTGPMGMGPMTGRGAGFCTGYGAPGFVNRGFRRGFFGFGRGAGRGWRNMYYATGLRGWQRFAPAVGVPPVANVMPPGMTAQEEIQVLKSQADVTAATLEQLRRRIDELTASAAEAPAGQ